MIPYRPGVKDGILIFFKGDDMKKNLGVKEFDDMTSLHACAELAAPTARSGER